MINPDKSPNVESKDSPVSEEFPGHLLNSGLVLGPWLRELVWDSTGDDIASPKADRLQGYCDGHTGSRKLGFVSEAPLLLGSSWPCVVDVRL